MFRSGGVRAIRSSLVVVVLPILVLSAAVAGSSAFDRFLDTAYRKHTDFEASLEALRWMDRDALLPEDRLSYDLFEWYLEDQAFVRSFLMAEPRVRDVPYARWLRHHTTTSLAPTELLRILSAEVARNRAQVDRILDALGIGGDSMAERMTVVAQIGRQKTADMGRSVADEMQSHVDAAEEAMRSYFGIYPSDPIVVTPVADLLSAAGLRMGSEARNRPNQVQILPGRDGVPYHLRLTIAHHEAFPGHYVQEHTQRQLPDLPAFRAQWGFAAYTEAWALYGEQLAWEVGLFDGTDPLHELGLFESKLWRSSKAMADVALHAHGWTADRTCRFLVDTLGMPTADAADTVARMIADPGAATASYTGYLQFIAFRERMRSALGDAFRLIDYHRLVLESGPMPMEILERLIAEHIGDHTPKDR